MATFTANGANGHHTFTLTVTDNTPSGTFVDSVIHEISYSFTISTSGGGWDWNGHGGNIAWYVNLGDLGYFDGTIPSYDGTSTVVLCSGTLNYTQTENGTLSFPIEFKVTDITGQNYTCGNALGSGTVSLTLQKKQYKVTYTGNGGLWNGQETWSNYATYGEDYYIEPNFFTRTGYSFVGWSENPDTTDSAWQGWEGKTWQWSYDRNVILYAIWKPQGMLHIKKNGTYVKGQTWIKHNGSWKKGIPWVKVNGIWKKGGA